MSEIPAPPAFPPPPPPPGGPVPASSDRTLMVILSYLGLLALIPYLTKKEDADIHWHAKNGVGLLILDVVIMVAWWILDRGLAMAGVPCGGFAIFCLVWLALAGLHIYCIIQAAGGKRPRIPVVTDFAEKSL